MHNMNKMNSFIFTNTPRELLALLDACGIRLDQIHSIGVEEHCYIVEMLDDIWLVSSTSGANMSGVNEMMVFNLKTMTRTRIDPILSQFTTERDTPISVDYLIEKYEKGWKHIAVELLFLGLKEKGEEHA